MAKFKLVYLTTPQRGYSLQGASTGVQLGFHPCPDPSTYSNASSMAHFNAVLCARKNAEMHLHMMEHDKGVRAALTHARDWTKFGPIENDPNNYFWSVVMPEVMA